MPISQIGLRIPGATHARRPTPPTRRLAPPTRAALASLVLVFSGAVAGEVSAARIQEQEPVVQRASGASANDRAAARAAQVREQKRADFDSLAATLSPDLLEVVLGQYARDAMRKVMARSPTIMNPPPFDTVLSVMSDLDLISTYLPEENWIVGHRVGLRALTGEFYDALQVASECRASGWWCAMLTGYTLTLLSEYPAAERAFDLAFAVMDEEERCTWTGDVELLLKGALRNAYRSADCRGKVELEPRIWWLANPLYLVPYNDRRTEHYARAVAMRLHHEALALVGDRCTDHHAAEMLLGWANWTASYLMAAPAGSVGFSFFPQGSSGIDPGSFAMGDWQMRPAIPFERFNPPYGPVHELRDVQVASFLRGDSMIVVAATAFEEHPLALAPSRIAAGLVLARDENDPQRVVNGIDFDGRYFFRTTVPVEPHLLSFEILSEEDGAARARLGKLPPARVEGDLALSDVLLFTWDPQLRQELNSVAPDMLGGERVRHDAELGIYWEVYGVESGDELGLSVVLVGEPPGLLRRLATALRLARTANPTVVRWTEVVGGAGDGMIGRSVRLGIDRVPTGEYSVEVTVQREGGEPRTSTRRLRIEG